MNTKLVVQGTTVAAVVLNLCACVAVPEERDIGAVQDLLANGHAILGAGLRSPETGATTPVSFAQPLTPEHAVGLALGHSPAARKLYANLGVVQADWLAASTLSNPSLSLSRQSSSEGGSRALLGYGLVQELTDVLFLRSRRATADGMLRAGHADAAASVRALAEEVARLWFTAVAATQQEQMSKVVAHASVSSAELAQRFHSAGNISDLELARERAVAAEALLAVAAAKSAAAGARLALNEAMGLRPPVNWRLPDALPPPASDMLAATSAELIASALANRLDVVARRQEAEALAGVAKLAQTLRWLPMLAIGVDGERETDGSRLLGPSLAVELPIFGGNRAGVLRADIALELALAEVDARELAVSNAVAAAHVRLTMAQERVARYRDVVLPLQRDIVGESQLLQNFMIIGQFELLQSKRDEYEAHGSYLRAVRDYWLARLDLDQATGAPLLAGVDFAAAGAGAVRLPVAPVNTGHAHHGPMHSRTPPSDPGPSAEAGAPAKHEHHHPEKAEHSHADH